MMNPVTFAGYCAWIGKEILSGTLDVFTNLVKPGQYGTPMIVEVPLRCESDLEITFFASSITITPGTLVVAAAAGDDETGRRPTLFVHSLFNDTEDEALDGLFDMEERLLRAMRGAGNVPERITPRTGRDADGRAAADGTEGDRA
ncbi:Na+/H+ antiporter subunit E [Brevibacterium samyangense]